MQAILKHAQALTGVGILLLAANIMSAEPDKLLFQDSFQGKLAEGWFWEREDAAHWKTGVAGLEVCVQPGNMWGPSNNAKNVLFRPLPIPLDSGIEISVALSNAPTAQWEQANLVWFYDDSNMVKLGQELVTGRLSIVMGREEKDAARTIAIVPLDANAVKLRLQAFGNHVRGQYRTAPRRHWSDIGECDLPVIGAPKASLQFYNGPANEEHWVRISNVTAKQLSIQDWPRLRAMEISGNAQSFATNNTPALLDLPGGFALAGDLRPMAGDGKADFDQKLFVNKDGSYGWSWNRRRSSNKQPIAAGVGWGMHNGMALMTTQELSASLFSAKSLELECDAVTRLENDQGDHNLAVVLFLSDETGTNALRRVVIEFDWYGKASDANTLNDGWRDYGLVPALPGSFDIRFRIHGFRGMPPQVNLKAFVDAAVKFENLGSKATRVTGVWFGNEVWDGSCGGTLVTALDLIIDGRHFSSTPSPK